MCEDIFLKKSILIFFQPLSYKDNSNSYKMDLSNDNISQIAERRWVKREKDLKSEVQSFTNNQYGLVTVKNGGVHDTETFISRSIGVYTLGLSLLFTSPMIVVKGVRTPENVRCVERLRRNLLCFVEDGLCVEE